MQYPVAAEALRDAGYLAAVDQNVVTAGLFGADAHGGQRAAHRFGETFYGYFAAVSSVGYE